MAVDRGAIDAQLREIGEGERWWEQREFRDLPYVLHADERIRGITTGKLVGSRAPRLTPRPTWLLVATDQRLIALRQERFGRKQVEIVPGQITRCHQSSRLRSYQIILETPARTFRVRIAKPDAYRFTSALEPLLPKPQIRPLHPDLEALAWIPGIRTVAALPGVTGIVSRVAMLSPPAPPFHPGLSARQAEALEAAVERLQEDVERLQQQVAFLEELLRKRAEEALLPAVPAEREAGS